MDAAAPVNPPPVAPPLLTAAEFVRRHQGDRVELVKEHVLEVAMPSPRHCKICATMARLCGSGIE